jgi:hypothetical protein
LDETLFARVGPFRRQLWSSQIIDVVAGQLLDVVLGRDSDERCRGFTPRPEAWRAGSECSRGGRQACPCRAALGARSVLPSSAAVPASCLWLKRFRTGRHSAAVRIGVEHPRDQV